MIVASVATGALHVLPRWLLTRRSGNPAGGWSETTPAAPAHRANGLSGAGPTVVHLGPCVRPATGYAEGSATGRRSGRGVAHIECRPDSNLQRAIFGAAAHHDLIDGDSATDLRPYDLRRP